jgi:hypothetical protein
MRRTIAALAFAGALSLVGYQNAGAIPADMTGMKKAANAASTVQQARYYARRGYVKCYHEFVIGRYRCHRFHRW